MKNFIKTIIPISVLNIYRKRRDKYAIKRKEKMYLADNVLCPICNSKFRVFHTGLKNRENAFCPNCKSLERHRLLYLFLKEENNIFEKTEKPFRILHFAPEEMFYSLFSKMDNIEYYPCDLYPELFKYNGGIPILKVDITNIPFEEGYFDFILCNHVLEHISNDKLAMLELNRVLKKGGSGIFQVPIDYDKDITYEDWNITDPEDRDKAFGQHDHVRIYGKDYKLRLNDCGFDVDENKFVKKFTSEELFRYGLISSELIYYCRK